MTTSKKGSSAAPKNRPPTPTSSTNRNRFEKLTDQDDDQKPSYSKVASSNRVTDFSVSDEHPALPPSTTKDSQDQKFDHLLMALQGITDRLNTMETKIEQIDPSTDNDDDRDNASSLPPDPSNEIPDPPRPGDSHAQFNPPSSANDHVNDFHPVDSIDPNVRHTENFANHRRGNFRNHNRRPESSETQQSYLNQNQFSLSVSNGKIKYIDMEKYLASRPLVSDSTESLKTMYETIVRSITYAFSTQLTVMPSFDDLDRNIHFKPYFLCGLFSENLDKCKTIFDHLGQILLDYLKNTTCISETRSPEAYTTVRANAFIGGWALLENLLKERLPSCGADLDDDLDAKRIALRLRDNESIREFYVRTQQLLNEYVYQATDSTFVPFPKIVRQFLSQLSRCPSYQPTIAPFQDELTDHISEFGKDNNLNPLNFTIKTIYDRLNKAKVPKVPTSLLAENIDIEQPSTKPTAPANPDYSSLIASLDSQICLECEEPTICASQMSGRTRCQACLLGFHDENDCFLRGDKFQPDGLKRRLKIFNKVNGDSPPPSHKMRDWDPPLIPPIHDKKNQQLNPNAMKRPFQNSRTKSTTKNISLLNAELVDPDENETLTDPSMSAFIQEQLSYEDNLETIDTRLDEIDGTICTSNHLFDIKHAIDECLQHEHSITPNENDVVDNNDSASSHSINALSDAPVISSSCNNTQDIRVTSINHDPFNYCDIAKDNKNIEQCTPIDITNSIHRVHHQFNNKPRKSFFLHHSSMISQLPSSNFEPYCSMNFHMDGGANCGSIRDKSLFYFFIKDEGRVKSVAGKFETSHGWGAILIEIGSKIYLLGPMYYFPHHPQNSFSPGSLLNYNDFSEVTVSTNKHVTFVSSAKTFHKSVTVHNDLDYATFRVMTMTPVSSVIASSQLPLRRSKRLANKQLVTPPLPPSELSIIQHSSTTVDFIVPSDANYLSHVQSTRLSLRPRVINRSTLLKIIEFTVQLSSPISDREITIQNLNSVLGTKLRSAEATYPSQALKLQTLSMHPSNHEVLLPVMANFSRASLRTLTPHQHWIMLHLGSMHTSSSSLSP